MVKFWSFNRLKSLPKIFEKTFDRVTMFLLLSLSIKKRLISSVGRAADL